MKDRLHDELIHLLQEGLVTSLLQPIVHLETQQVFGYESLSRGPSDSPLHAAPVLFELAEKYALSDELEALCLKVAAKNWASHALDCHLFVNISPAMLLPSRFSSVQLRELMRRHDLEPQQIVIEISERFPALQLQELKNAIAWLKAEGFSIAIDDLGTGYSGLKLWSDLQPDFVKIDRHFIRDIHEDLVKLEFVRSLVELSDRLGCRLIAEGVENQAELTVVADLGIELIQGFLVGRPKPYPTADLSCLPDRQQVVQKTTGRLARDLCEYVEPVTPDTTLREAWERLQRNLHIFSLPVVQEDGRPVGLLHKWRVLELYGSQYGRALFERRAVINFIGRDSLVVDQRSTLDEISQRLIEEDFHYLKQHFIVVNEGIYVGLGTTRRLLKQITQERIEKARYANPLTQLPGNVPINNELDKRLKRVLPFVFIYIDINDFKPLNDILGYQAGDLVITRLAELLLVHFNYKGDFVGHVGGDDFVVMTEREDVDDVCRALQRRFMEMVRSVYPSTVQEQGYLLAQDRDGQPKQFPLSSIAIALIKIESPNEYTSELIADYAADAKKASKIAMDHFYSRLLI